MEHDESSVDAYNSSVADAFIEIDDEPPIFTNGIFESAPNKNDTVTVEDFPKKFFTESVTKYVFASK